MKVFASDYDGTIYFEDGFRQDDIAAIKEFQDSGNKFGLCTGRPLLSVLNDPIKYDFYIVCSGAYILDGNLKVLYLNCLDKDIVIDIYNEFKDNSLVIIQANKTLYAFKENEVSLDQIIISSFDELQGDIYGLSLRVGSEQKANKVVEYLNNKYSNISVYQNKEFIDISPKNNSKGTGIEFIKKYYNSDVYVIGDSYNDIPMLECTYSFTFNNSPEVVKSKANKCVDSLKEAIEYLK